MKIVYFDGYCNVCNRFIDFLIRRDHKRELKYAPLQGATARARLKKELTERVDTMAFEVDGRVSTESSAAIQCIGELGGVYRWMRVFLLVPKVLRDGAYRWIANHRYRYFGKRDSCRIPTAEERAQFLD